MSLRQARHALEHAAAEHPLRHDAAHHHGEPKFLTFDLPASLRLELRVVWHDVRKAVREQFPTPQTPWLQSSSSGSLGGWDWREQADQTQQREWKQEEQEEQEEQGGQEEQEEQEVQEGQEFEMWAECKDELSDVELNERSKRRRCGPVPWRERFPRINQQPVEMPWHERFPGINQPPPPLPPPILLAPPQLPPQAPSCMMCFWRFLEQKTAMNQ